MNLNSVLASIRNLYLEAAPFIYFVEANSSYVARMDFVFGRLDAGHMYGFTSSITLTEVLTLPIRVGRIDLQDAYRAILRKNTSVSLVSVNDSIAEQAAVLRAKYNLRTPDALHIATALVSRCDGFLTNDKGFRRVAEITILVIDDLVI